MPTYLVRIIKGRDLVGIFVAPDVFALAMLVDECTDPDSCEYQRLKPGGIMWTSSAVVVPIGSDSDDDDEDTAPAMPWSGATFTESWWASVYEWSGKGRWRPIGIGVEDLYGIDPEEPEPDPPPKGSSPIKTARILLYRKREN